MAAAEALIAMATQRSRAATCDGSQHLLMLSVDPTAAAVDEGPVRRSERCQPSPAKTGLSVAYSISGCCQLQHVERIGGRAQVLVREMKVDRGLFKHTMPE